MLTNLLRSPLAVHWRPSISSTRCLSSVSTRKKPAMKAKQANEIKMDVETDSEPKRKATVTTVGGIPVWTDAVMPIKEEGLILDASPLLWSLAYRGVASPEQIVSQLDKTCMRVIAKRKPKYAALVLDSPGSRQQKQKIIDTYKEESTQVPAKPVDRVQKLSKELIKDDKALKSQVSEETIPDPARESQLPDARLDFEYKANRVATGAGDIVKEALLKIRNRSIPFNSMAVVDMPETEADDVIATLTRIVIGFSSHSSVVIASADKDFFQLLADSRVSMLRGPRAFYIAKDEISRDWVTQNIGVLPEQFVDFLALCGDAIDNVPGVKGVGKVRAQRLLEEYGTLDRILEAAATRKHQSALWQEIANSVAVARLSREIVTLNQHVPLVLPKGLASWREALKVTTVA